MNNITTDNIRLNEQYVAHPTFDELYDKRARKPTTLVVG